MTRSETEQHSGVIGNAKPVGDALEQLQYRDGPGGQFSVAVSNEDGPLHGVREFLEYRDQIYLGDFYADCTATGLGRGV
ncbi:MAG: hypothetical protein JO287_26140 [Pseudonocardiales bacterium]|nr:hypothetical protein [Pseudonocardiales bacterium]